MSSFLDIPQSLLMVLSLAAMDAGEVGSRLAADWHAPSSAAVAASNEPCRFRTQIWLEALHAGAGGEAFAYYSSRVFRTSGGRYYVPRDEDRRELADLHRDPAISCFIALSHAQANRVVLEAELGRPAGTTELFAAHVLGVADASRLATLAREAPSASAAEHFPEQVDGLPEIFTDARGPATLARVWARLRTAVERASQKAPKPELAGAEATVVSAHGAPRRLAEPLVSSGAADALREQVYWAAVVHRAH